MMQPKTIKSKNNNFFENGRQPQFFFKGTQPQISENGRRSQNKLCNQQ